jgi:hypothetical protein
MKKYLKWIVFLLFLSVPILAQDVEPPADWGDVIDGFSTWFGTLAGIAALTVFLAGVLNGLLKVSKKIVKQLVAWLIAIVLSVVANVVNMGFLAEATWLMTVLYGFGAGLVANGIFDVTVVKAIIAAIEAALNKEK